MSAGPPREGFRATVPEDAPRCVDIRGRTREHAFSADALRTLGITAHSWAEDIRAGRLIGHLCTVGGEVVGHGFLARETGETGEIVVVALLAEHEAQGIGRALMDRLVADGRRLGWSRLHLGCSADPASRSHGFYRRLGWTPTGEIDALGDEVLELRLR